MFECLVGAIFIYSSIEDIFESQLTLICAIWVVCDHVFVIVYKEPKECFIIMAEFHKLYWISNVKGECQLT